MDTPMSVSSTIAEGRRLSAPLDSGVVTPSHHNAIAQAGSVGDAVDRVGAGADVEKAVQFPNNVVEWDGPNDPESPRNWSSWRKILFVITTSSMIIVLSFGSAVFAPAAKITAEQFDVSLEVMQLAVSLWILGFFAGPIFFGPLSEIFGHLIPLTVSMTGLAVFQLPIALGENVRTILICRFFSGMFGSGIMATVSGMYVELYEPIPRGVALSFSGVAINLGATIAPIGGVYLTYEINWRWTAWVTLIGVGVLGIISLFTVRESSSRRILATKARRLRFETQNWALHAKSEETKIEFRDIVHKYLTKPIRMFVTEPILIILTIYLTLVYGTLYLSFQAFPYTFQLRGWSVTSSSLPFIAVMLGLITAAVSFGVFTMTWYKARAMKVKTGPAAPELRLPPMIAGSLMVPPALLWFGWSGNVHWISQVLASYFIGLGLMLIFIAGIVYIVDVYQVHANSAMSIHVVVRSLVACSFPLFANQMYTQLGVAWASSLLAFLCVIMVPAPIVFFFYGHKIRSWSRFSFTL